MSSAPAARASLREYSPSRPKNALKNRIGVGRRAMMRCGRLHAVHAGHDEIHGDEVGPQLLGELDRLTAGAGHADDADARVGLQHAAQHFASDR